MLKNSRSVSLELYDIKGKVNLRDVDIYKAKDEVEKIKNKYNYKLADSYKLKTNSSFISRYEQEKRRIQENLNKKIDGLFGDNFGGKYLKDKMKRNFEFYIPIYGIKDIRSVSFFL